MKGKDHDVSLCYSRDLQIYLGDMLFGRERERDRENEREQSVL